MESDHDAITVPAKNGGDGHALGTMQRQKPATSYNGLKLSKIGWACW